MIKISEGKIRVAGSGYTTLLFQGIRLAYLQVIQDTPPTPVATAVAVQPIDEPVPVEIVIPAAVGVGTIRMTFYERWLSPVWATLPGLEGTFNLLEVLRRQLALGNITMQKLVRSPSGLMRARVYHNVVIVDIDEGENVNIGTMVLPKTLTCLAGDTPFQTIDGTKTLREVVDTEQKVLGIHGEWTPADIRSFGVQPLHEVVLTRKGQTKKILATDEHRWIYPDLSETTTAGLLADQALCTVDGAEWTVASVTPTGLSDEVFCAVVPDGHAFVLDDDLMTGNCQYTYSTPV